LENLAGLNEEVKLQGRYWSESYKANRGWYVTSTWRKVFSYVSPYLVSHPNAGTVKTVLGLALFREANAETLSNDRLKDLIEIDDQDFQTIGVQLKALGLVNIDYTKTTTGGMGLFWSFTAKGERLMLELRTVRSEAKPVGTPIPLG
jgi:hypothetical protein